MELLHVLYYLIILAIILIIYLTIRHYQSNKKISNITSIQQEMKLCNKDIDCIRNVFYKYDERDMLNEVSKKCKLCDI